jgi:hypothetical protein
MAQQSAFSSAAASGENGGGALAVICQSVSGEAGG